jgi:S-(hydroxymethyl)glutathione dehydrogenase / alcohol dehydrogenase
MRAAVLNDGSTELVVEELAIDAPGPTEVVIDVEACGLCHSDYHYIDGTLNRPRPQVLGHEAVGIVVAVGGSVTMHKIGDRVVTCLVTGCGQCERCRRGDRPMCTNPNATKRSPGQTPRLMNAAGKPVGGMGGIGALADQVIMDERGLIAIPSDMPAPLAAILGCAVVTGLGAAFNVAKIQPGDTVAIIGCGGVGLNVLQGARISGAARIIAIDLSTEKLDLARRLGATDMINASDGDPVAAVQSLTGGGVDHAFEVIGRPATLAQAFEMARVGGTAYLVGVMPDDAVAQVSAMGLRRGKSLKGVFMGNGDPHLDIPRAVNLWQRGLLDLESMVSRTLPLDEVNEGFAALARGEVARAVVVM